MFRLLAGLAILALTVPPPLAGWWEGAMLRHMLGQIPLLVIAGVLLVPVPRADRPRDPMFSSAAVVAASFCLTFWMIPRWLDGAVTDPRVDAIKIVTLVTIGGMGLGWGWPRLPGLLRAFIWANFISMLGATGLLYAWFPDRLCNAYLEGEQITTGNGLLILAAALGLLGAGQAFLGSPRLRDGAGAENVPPDTASRLVESA